MSRSPSEAPSIDPGLLQKLASNSHLWLKTALDLVFPPWCQICRLKRASCESGFVCDACQNGLQWLQPPFCEKCALPYAGSMDSNFRCANCEDMDLAFSHARSCLIVTPTFSQIIHRYKYNGHKYFEPLLTSLFVARAAPSLQSGSWTWIVPVPLHPVRRREREFNQAECLSRELSSATGIPLNVRCLSRVQNTSTQTALGREDRRRNVNKAFTVNNLEMVRAARIVVVDDVLTTGATTDACARSLLKAGAEEVAVWTLARGLVGQAALNLGRLESRIDSLGI